MSDVPLLLDAPEGRNGAGERSGGPFVLRALVPVALAMLLVTVVYALVFPNLWYGEHDISDIGIYRDHALVLIEGLLPYRDFDLEYPPLAPAVFALPGHTVDFASYTHWFSVWMYVASLATAVVTALVGVVLWPVGRRAWLVAVAAGLAVAAVGTIIENRFDIAVALCMVTALLFLCLRRPLPAAAALGVGFALKLTPIVLLPLVLLLAGRPRRMLATLAAFAVSAALPFIPYLVMAPRGVAGIFTYHLDRPLQIESVLATPFLIGHALDRLTVEIVTSYGSQGIAATGAATVAALSTMLSAAALVLTTVLVWRRRDTFLAQPDLIPTAALAFLLAGMVFGKVLSPQYLVWLVPFVAVVVVRDPWLGVLGFASLLLTQIGFPGKYWGLVYLETPAIMWLAARNAVLLATFVLAVVRLWQVGGRRARAFGRGPAELRGGVAADPGGGTGDPARTAAGLDGGTGDLARTAGDPRG
jgi:hypothetical protein